jgi:hypothetical protein
MNEKTFLPVFIKMFKKIIHEKNSPTKIRKKTLLPLKKATPELLFCAVILSLFSLLFTL